MLYSCNKVKEVLPFVTHAANWTKMSSATSPYVFQYGNDEEVAWVTSFLEKNKYALFLRKVDPSFPDHMLRNIIYTSKKNKYIIQQRVKLFYLENWCFIQKNKWAFGIFSLFLFLFFVFNFSLFYI
jgi:uncharacterized protein YlbG (UPF0298 family)